MWTERWLPMSADTVEIRGFRARPNGQVAQVTLPTSVALAIRAEADTGGGTISSVIRSRLLEEQPPPRPDTGPDLWPLVIADFEAMFPNVPGLCEAGRERDRIGRRRYGTPLQANNGRSAARDVTDELLDASVYARQAVEEAASDDKEISALYVEALTLTARVFAWKSRKP